MSPPRLWLDLIFPLQSFWRGPLFAVQCLLSALSLLTLGLFSLASASFSRRPFFTLAKENCDDRIETTHACRHATTRIGPGTQKVYLKAVQRLAGHYRRSPDRLSEQELRDYFAYLVQEKRVASSTLRTEIFGVKFLFDKTLQRPWPTLRFLRARPRAKLPVVLDQHEAHRLIGLIRCEAVRMCGTLMYSCGLRIRSIRTTNRNAVS